jgi:hypothetical protein
MTPGAPSNIVYKYPVFREHESEIQTLRSLPEFVMSAVVNDDIQPVLQRLENRNRALEEEVKMLRATTIAMVHSIYLGRVQAV